MPIEKGKRKMGGGGAGDEREEEENGLSRKGTRARHRRTNEEGLT